MAWQTVGTRVAYENRWIRVREDEVLRPDGAPGIYGVVELRHPAVFIVAVDDEQRVLLVTLDRYTTGPASTEVPAGGTDGEEPLAAARRELLEETGFEASEWTEVGRMEALNGVATAPEHVFLARGLSPAVAPELDATQREEGIAEVRWVPFAEVLELIAEGRIRDGETVAALAFAGIRLGRFA